MPIKPYLEIGQIVTTHGIAGEVRIQPWCDDAAVLAELNRLYLDASGKRSIRVEQARVHKNVVVARLEGIDSVEQAQAVRGKTVYVDRADLALEEGAWFVQDLIGCTVVDADNPTVVYGRLEEVLQPGANDVYRLVDEQGRDRLVPVIPDVVLDVNPEAGMIRIRPLKGLFDDAD